MARTTTRQFNIHAQKAIFWIFAGILALLIFMYSYFVNATVLSVVERKDFRERASTAAAEVAETESVYFSRISTLTLARAITEGFREVEPEAFIPRKTLARSILTFNSTQAR